MFRLMFNQIVSFLSSSYLLPFWFACGAVVIAGAAAVVVKSIFWGCK